MCHEFTPKELGAEKERRNTAVYGAAGISRASREFIVSTAAIYNWKKKFEELGAAGLETGAKTAVERELAQLKRENSELKKMVAERELAIRVKDALLKKNAFLKKKK